MNNFLIKKLARNISPILYYSGIGKFAKKIYGGKGHILMFHRVLPQEKKPRIHNHQSLEISVEKLEEIVNFFSKNKYKAISLEQFYNFAQEGKLPQKFVIYTFDDGYKDNLNHAFPVFERHQIPFTVYITTSFPNRTSLIWWYALEDLLLKKDVIYLDYEGKESTISCDTTLKKELAFNNIRAFLNKIEEQYVNTFFKKNDIEIKNYVNDLALTWEEIVELSKSPLVTIGAHTQSHKALSALSDKKCFDDIQKSKLEIEENIGKEVNHFSYPFGKKQEASRREFDIVKEIGFKTATTTRLGNIFNTHRNYLEALPRITINSLTTMNDLKLQLAGVFPMLKNKMRRVITD